jgi:hypothetical protein
MPGIFAAEIPLFVSLSEYFNGESMRNCAADCGNQIAVVRLVPVHAELRRHPPDS